MTLVMMDDVAQLDSYSAGAYGFTVRVYRRQPDGPFHYEIRSTGERKVIRPKIFNPAEAHRWANRRSEEIERGIARVETGRTDLAFLFDTYLANRTPQKAKRTQKEDQRKAKMWKRVLGANLRPAEIRLYQWNRFIAERSSGAIGPDGASPGPGGRSPVSPRTVVSDLKWLKAVMRWAAAWRTPSGAYLLDTDPLRGFPLPADKNPRREMATHERYLAIMESLRIAIRQDCKPWMLTLRNMLPIVRWQGRRIGSVRLLQHGDVHLSEAAGGMIDWRAESDKEGRRSSTPLHPEARAAIQRARGESPGAGKAWLFPSSRDPRKAYSRSQVLKMFRKAEELAGLEPLAGTRWHAYRRLRATELKRAGIPIKDAADFLGMSTETLQRIYQKGDRVSLREAALVGPVLEEREKMA